MVYHKTENFEKAVWAYDYAILINDNFGSAFFNKGNSLSELERFEEALESYKKTLEIEGADAMIFCSMANCYEKLDMMQSARSFYKKAIKLNPELADAWFGIGVTFDAEEKYHDAIVYFKKAINLEEDEADFWFALADTYFKAGLHDKADEAYGKTCGKDVKYWEAWLDWSVLQLKINNIERAKEIIEECIFFNENQHQPHYRLAAYEYLYGDKQNAYDSFANALRLNFDDNFLFFDLVPEAASDFDIVNLLDTYLP